MSISQHGHFGLIKSTTSFTCERVLVYSIRTHTALHWLSGSLVYDHHHRHRNTTTSAPCKSFRTNRCRFPPLFHESAELAACVCVCCCYCCCWCCFLFLEATSIMGTFMPLFKPLLVQFESVSCVEYMCFWIYSVFARSISQRSILKNLERFSFERYRTK